MALEFRRGKFAELQTITPLEGEPIWTTDTSQLYIGDGVTPGGLAVNGTFNGDYVSRIIAGDNITINTSTGEVTITGQAGGGSTSTYETLTVTSELTIGSGINTGTIKSIHVTGAGGNLDFQSMSGHYRFRDAPDSSGAIVSIDNELEVFQINPNPVAGEGSLILINADQVTFGGASDGTGTIAVGVINFPDSTQQTTAASLGNLAIDGTWLRNKTDGDIYISPQDGQTGVYFPSDTNAVSQAVELFNVNSTGQVRIDAGSKNWLFSYDGSIKDSGSIINNFFYQNKTTADPIDMAPMDMTIIGTVKYVVQVRELDGNSFHSQECMMIGDGTNTWMSQSNVLTSGSELGTFSISSDGTTAYLRFTPNYTPASMDIRVNATAILL